jgi:branched-subunit amino acid aminotransferase/4-amino-4-deoxychorismate lyase
VHWRRNEADEHGADEAVFVDENGIVAEGRIIEPVSR